MKIVYNEADQKIIEGQEQILEDFDHLFFKKCKAQNMTNHEAMQALQNCEQRNEMIKNIFNVRALMMPSYIVNDDC